MNNKDLDNSNSIIGIIGGVGPYAGMHLMKRILDMTKVSKDQDHLSVALLSYPSKIGDRTDYLLGKTNINPAYSISSILLKLEQVGAKIAGIACNTSYAPPIFNVICSELKNAKSKLILLNIVNEALDYVNKEYSDVKKIGLLTTSGTYKFKIYSEPLTQMGYEVILPDEDFQQNVIHKMIYDSKYGIKANSNFLTREAKKQLDMTIRFFKERKSEAIILGCSEFSMISKDELTNEFIWIDTIDVFANALIKEQKNITINQFNSVIT